jgi:prepilin-type N-terminal cleavage/methylation domain-containing protein
MKHFNASKGFTLAELLIALAILGVIATFTIPKILSSSANGQNTAIAKEAASMVSGAFQNLALNNGISSTNTGADLTQYMNYVSVVTTGASGTVMTGAACTATLQCLKLHNGGVMMVDTGLQFGGTAAANGIYVNVDPDGTGTATAISFIQYANGRMTTRGQAGGAPTTGGTLTISPVTSDPSYLTNWN